MALLGLFNAEHRESNLDEMVARLGVSRMTAYRMARTLQGTGHLVHDPGVGRYRLGPAMLAGIYLAEGFAQLVAVSRPYLEGLVEETGELAAAGRRAGRGGRLRRPRGLGPALRARDRRGAGDRGHGQRARQDVRGP